MSTCGDQNEWIFLAKGKANAVFYNVREKYVVRVRMRGKTHDVYRGLKNHLEPALGAHHCTKTDLINIAYWNFVIKCPEGIQLSDLEWGLAMEFVGQDPLSRITTYLEDCQVHKYESSYVIEMKPKWLIQSPSAPAGWIKCRTCALKLKRTGKHSKTCRLRLGSDNHQVVTQELRQMLEGHECANELSIIAGKAVAQSGVLQAIKRVQSLDVHGPLRHNDRSREQLLTSSMELLNAMACRDCTLFIEVWHEEASPKYSDDYMVVDGRYVRTKLADLDVKPEKLDHWVATEKSLREYYLKGTAE